MNFVLLLLSMIGLGLAWNVDHPRVKTPIPSITSFALGWLYGSLALWVIGVQVLCTLLIIRSIDNIEALGFIGLFIAFFSWLLLARHYIEGRELKPLTEKALKETLGTDYKIRIPSKLINRVPETFSIKRYLTPFSIRLPEVSCIENLTVDSVDGWDVNIDIYRHVDCPVNAPVLYQIHGGGWMEDYGDKRHQALPLMNHLALQGWVCVTVDYRLSPTHVWPSHIVDCKKTLCWIKDNIAQYGGDPNFIVATGGSAGGHLSSLLALTANAPEYQPGFEDRDTSVNACIPYYGVYDFTDASGHHLHDGIMQALQDVVIQRRLEDDEDWFKKASPIYRVHADAPPTFAIHGSVDSLTSVTEAREFIKRLKSASKQTVGYLEVPGAQHAFDIFNSPRADWAMRAAMIFAIYQYAIYLEKR